MKTKRTLMFAILSVLSSRALATDLSVTYGYQFGGEFDVVQDGEVSKDSYNLNDEIVYTLALDIPSSKSTAVGTYISHQATALPLSKDKNVPEVILDVNYFHLTASERFKHSKRWESYVAGGAGITYFNPDELDSHSRFSLGLGFGGLFFLADFLALKFETRGFMTLMDSDSAVFCGSNGCKAWVSSPTLFQANASAGLLFRF